MLSSGRAGDARDQEVSTILDKMPFGMSARLLLTKP